MNYVLKRDAKSRYLYFWGEREKCAMSVRDVLAALNVEADQSRADLKITGLKNRVVAAWRILTKGSA